MLSQLPQAKGLLSLSQHGGQLPNGGATGRDGTAQESADAAGAGSVPGLQCQRFPITPQRPSTLATENAGEETVASLIRDRGSPGTRYDRS